MQILRIEDVERLPSVTCDQLSSLPEKQGVYFVVRSQKVMYIGLSTNIRTRWQNHHRKPQTFKTDSIHWVEHTKRQTLRDRERELIEAFCPSWNGSFVLPSSRISSYEIHKHVDLEFASGDFAPGHYIDGALYCSRSDVSELFGFSRNWLCRSAEGDTKAGRYLASINVGIECRKVSVRSALSQRVCHFQLIEVSNLVYLLPAATLSGSSKAATMLLRGFHRLPCIVSFKDGSKPNPVDVAGWREKWLFKKDNLIKTNRNMLGSLS